MIFSFFFGLVRENIFRISPNFLSLFFFIQKKKDNTTRILKKENLESENYFSKKFSFLETIFSHFFPIQVEGEVQKSQNIRNVFH